MRTFSATFIFFLAGTTERQLSVSDGQARLSFPSDDDRDMWFELLS